MRTKIFLIVMFFGFAMQSWGQEKSKYFDLSFDNDEIIVYDLTPQKKKL